MTSSACSRSGSSSYWTGTSTSDTQSQGEHWPAGVGAHGDRRDSLSCRSGYPESGIQRDKVSTVLYSGGTGSEWWGSGADRAKDRERGARWNRRAISSPWGRGVERGGTLGTLVCLGTREETNSRYPWVHRPLSHYRSLVSSFQTLEGSRCLVRKDGSRVPKHIVNTRSESDHVLLATTLLSLPGHQCFEWTITSSDTASTCHSFTPHSYGLGKVPDGGPRAGTDTSPTTTSGTGSLPESGCRPVTRRPKGESWEQTRSETRRGVKIERGELRDHTGRRDNGKVRVLAQFCKDSRVSCRFETMSPSKERSRTGPQRDDQMDREGVGPGQGTREVLVLLDRLRLLATVND